MLQTWHTALQSRSVKPAAVFNAGQYMKHVDIRRNGGILWLWGKKAAGRLFATTISNPREKGGSGMNTQLLGACTVAVREHIPHWKTIFSDFPRLKELVNVRDDEFYPLNLYLDTVQFVEDTFRDDIVMYQFGRDVGKSVIQASLAKLSLHSVGDAVRAVQSAHEYFCRPVRGAFAVTDEGPGFARVNYTAPYHCVLQEGLLHEIAAAYGGADVTVEQKRCRRRGDPACLFALNWTQMGPGRNF